MQYCRTVPRGIARRLTGWLLFVLLLAALLVAAIRLSPRAARELVAPLAGIDELQFHPDPSTRLLVIAPHPDDESLGAAGLIRRVITSGGAVRVVLATSGDAFPEGVAIATHKRTPRPADFRAYGKTREAETLVAMQRLGVDRSQVRFLGFPDGGLCLIAASYLTSKTRAYESPYTGRRQPPSSEQVIRGIGYRGSDVRRELEAVLAAYQPTLVVIPTAEDEHPDHCATAIFAREALDILESRHRSQRTILEYLIHDDDWPDETESTANDLRPPRPFSSPGQQWRTFKLRNDETGLKRWVLFNAYPSQTLIIGKFLQAFGRPNELLLEGRTTVAPECWCDGDHVATELPPSRYRRPRKTRR
jgi:LmbE family N-acetylglucosaminyl deacetylase